MEYTLEMAEKMAEKLRALPPIDESRRRLNKQKVVNHLAAEIISLQQRGYTLEQVADSLRGVGLDITTPTLKSYLQRTKKNAKGTRQTQRSARRQSAPTAAQATLAAARESRPESKPDAPKSTRSEFIATDRQKL
jgi:hypothetical protein